MIWDSPPHSGAIYGPAVNAPDGGGGDGLTWPTVRQAGVPCLINTASANEQARYRLQFIVVTHTVSILSSVLTSTPERGDKFVAADTGHSYHVRGIRSGREFMDIPAFTYLDVEEALG